MKTLTMGANEICCSYRNSHNPKKQIQVLAQLNACSNDEIIAVLKENGIVIDGRSCRVQITEELREQMRQMRDHGHSVSQIAQVLGVANITVTRNLQTKPSNPKPAKAAVPPKNTAAVSSILPPELPPVVPPDLPPAPLSDPIKIEAYCKIMIDRMDAAMRNFEQHLPQMAFFCLGELRSAIKAVQNEINRKSTL